MADSLGTTLVAGVGPGLGAALARRFAAAGSPVALAARSEETIAALAQELGSAGAQAVALPYDVSDEQAVGAAIEEANRRLGPVRTLVYNVGNAARGGIEKMSAAQFRAAFEVGPLGAFLHCRTLLPQMESLGGGTVLFTGATSSLRSPAHSPAFGAAKFGLRGLAMSLSRTWTPRGVHIAHVVIDGVIRTPRTVQRMGEDESYLLPQAIAETYYQLAVQDRSAWTFELEVRPFADDYMEN